MLVFELPSKRRLCSPVKLFFFPFVDFENEFYRIFIVLEKNFLLDYYRKHCVKVGFRYNFYKYVSYYWYKEWVLFSYSGLEITGQGLGLG